MRKLWILLILLLFVISGCSSQVPENPSSIDEMCVRAAACLEEHKEDMLVIIQEDAAAGSADWCTAYHLLPDSQYEFVLQQSGFVGTNTKSGLLYIPDDLPGSAYTQSEDNSDVYYHENGSAEQCYLQRLEQCWFFFYISYDF